MRRTSRLGLFVALLAFGAVLTSTRPAYAWIPSCEGRSDLLCETKTTESCTKRTICGLSSSGIVTCCEKKETTVDYYYWDADF